jgi:zinc transporter
LHERARLLLDELDAKMTTVTNRRLFTLSILTACLLLRRWSRASSP